MSSAPFKKFLHENLYQLLTAVVTALLVGLTAYVSFQLWQQEVNFRLDAIEKNQGQPPAGFENLNSKVDILLDDMKTVKAYLLNNK